MTQTSRNRTETLFTLVGTKIPESSQGLVITCPADGSTLATLQEDEIQSLHHKINAAKAAQIRFAHLTRSQRESYIETLSSSIKAAREPLAELITLEGGKTSAEAQSEADGSADILLKTIKDAALPELSGMIRTKERPPIGLVGLITSFNFPLAVANWTIAPAILAGNGVIWKPSEKTPLTALYYKHIFDIAMKEHKDLLQVTIGGRVLGEALVASEDIQLISATGSVAMGQGIKATLAKRKTPSAPPILELGGNNGVIISEKMSDTHLQWSIASLLNSFFGTSGQRCTNTRRLIVHSSQYEATITLLQKHITNVITSGTIKSPLEGNTNPYGYGPLIDADAYKRFEKAKQSANEQGGKIWGGARLMQDQFPEAYYVEPALAIMPSQSQGAYEETFAPLLYVIPYDGNISEALTLLNAPQNAGLVSAIYTQSQKEADIFASESQAGHIVINPPKGTGTPAFGMGFGGNKASGEGEILNASDPLRPFTQTASYRRIAQNKDIQMHD